MLFSPLMAAAPLVLAVSAAELPRPDPETVETRVQAQIQARAAWKAGDRLRFGLLKPVTCRDGLLRRERRRAWALEITWSHAATGASERLHAQVQPNGEPSLADGAVGEIGSACRWSD